MESWSNYGKWHTTPLQSISELTAFSVWHIPYSQVAIKTAWDLQTQIAIHSLEHASRCNTRHRGTASFTNRDSAHGIHHCWAENCQFYATDLKRGFFITPVKQQADKMNSSQGKFAREMDTQGQKSWTRMTIFLWPEAGFGAWWKWWGWRKQQIDSFQWSLRIWEKRTRALHCTTSARIQPNI